MTDRHFLSRLLPAFVGVLAVSCLLGMRGVQEGGSGIRDIIATSLKGDVVVTERVDDPSKTRKSSIRWDCHALHDPRCPVDFVDTPELKTLTGVPGIDSRLSTKYELEIREPITAIEIHFLVFDIWGECVPALSAVEVSDMPSGRIQMDHRWIVSSTQGVMQTSVVYVAKARTANGVVYVADKAALTKAVRQLSLNVTDADF